MQIQFKKLQEMNYSSLLDLQSENFVDTLDEKQKESGFLSVKFTKKQFREMNSDTGVIVALNDNQVVGYLCMSSLEYNLQFPILDCMYKYLSLRSGSHSKILPDNTLVMGPICIRSNYRGMGIFQGLYDNAHIQLKQDTQNFVNMITFVSADNQRSIQAHTKVDMRPFGCFEYVGSIYHVLLKRIPSFDLARSS